MAVEDLISVAAGGEAGATPEAQGPAIDDLRKHYSGLMYRAVLTCTKSSLNVIKKMTCCKVGTRQGTSPSHPPLIIRPGACSVQRRRAHEHGKGGIPGVYPALLVRFSCSGRGRRA